MHNTPLASHTGRTKTYEKLRQRFFWVGMWKDVKHLTKTCLVCRKAKQRVPRSAGYLRPRLYDESFDTLAIDLVGPFPRTKKWKHCCSYLLRLFYALAYFHCITKYESRTVAPAFVDYIICEHGCPRKLLSDRGTQFLAELVQHVCRIL